MTQRGDVNSALRLASAIQSDADSILGPPEEGGPARSDLVLIRSVTRGTRGYIEQIVEQINGCYENGWYDACAVMVRRLVETLIIEAFEKHNASHLIKTPSGELMYLRDLIDETLKFGGWNLGRNAKKALPKLKDVGDKSAHSRRFVAHKADIERLIPDLRTTVQELVYLAALK